MLDLAARALESIQRDNERDPDLLCSPEGVCLATFWRQATPGVSYYRCLLPARYLPGQMVKFDLDRIGWDMDYELGDVHGLRLPLHRGVAVWSYLGDDARARVACALQDQGVRTLMECDDNYTQGPKKWGVNWADTHQEAQGVIGYSHEQNRYLANLMDGMIVSTPYLAEVYGEFNDNVYVCRNSIDPFDWNDILPQKHDDLRIVYAGSNVHVFDYPLVNKALKWAHRQPGVESWIWGFDPPPSYRGNVEGWVDGLDEYRKNLARFDIGLCPLQDTPWNRSKSDIKAIEYAMAGVLPIVARTEAYAPWWRDLGWEYVAQTENEWQEIIRHLVKNYDEVVSAAAAAKKYVITQRTIYDEIGAWREAILGA